MKLSGTVFCKLILWLITFFVFLVQVVPVNAINIPKNTKPFYRRVRVQIFGSRNWAGYSAINGIYTSVSGTWIVPAISPSGHTSADATWVGIGGIWSSDLIQSGTQNMITKTGQVMSEAWIEMLPYTSQQIPITVTSGDSVSAAITNIGGNHWQFTFRNNTTGHGYQTVQSYTSSRSSAEWIEESPSNGIKILPLDNFGTVSFSNCLTEKNGTTITIAQSGGQSITMLGAGGKRIAVPSQLGSDGVSFTVTRTNAVSAPSIPQYDQNPGSWRRQGQGVGGSDFTPNPDTVTPILTITPILQGGGFSKNIKFILLLLFSITPLICLYYLIDKLVTPQNKNQK